MRQDQSPLQQFHRILQGQQFMNKLEQIRNQIIQSKRRSFFSLKPIEESLDFLPQNKTQRTATIDSESNFSLFPLIAIGEECGERKGHGNSDSGDCTPCEKIQLRPFLREKRSKKAETCEVTWRSHRVRNDSVENVSSLMARSYVPYIRINKAAEPQPKQPSRSKRLSNMQSKEAKPAIFRRESRPKKASPTKSPKRFRRFSRTRRTISPKKMLSPVRKFSISAWEIPMEESEF